MRTRDRDGGSALPRRCPTFRNPALGAGSYAPGWLHKPGGLPMLVKDNKVALAVREHPSAWHKTPRRPRADGS